MAKATSSRGSPHVIGRRLEILGDKMEPDMDPCHQHPDPRYVTILAGPKATPACLSYLRGISRRGESWKKCVMAESERWW